MYLKDIIRGDKIVKTKWVCPVCSTTNICEKKERMICFVCGNYFDETKHASISLSTTHTHDFKSSDVSVAKHGIREKINNIAEKIKSIFRLTESDGSEREIVDWTIEHSSSDCKEAYIEATPIYDKEKDSITDFELLKDIVSDEDSIKERRKDEHTVITTHVSELSEDITLWPEHEGKFDFDKLRSMECVDIKKENLNGNKCYKLLYKNGSERILSLANMKMIGYIMECSLETSEDKSANDFHSFIPWPEHNIVFDMKKLNITGCVNVEQTEVSGKKYYKLTYRNGIVRIMNIYNLKMMGYVRDI